MDFDGETIEDALGMLQEIVLWELPPQRWEQVAQLLDRIAAAHAARDAEKLRAAVVELELYGPTRIVRIGSTRSGIPEPVLDRQNTLVHALGQEQQPTSPAGGKPEGGRGA